MLEPGEPYVQLLEEGSRYESGPVRLRRQYVEEQIMATRNAVRGQCVKEPK